jgi:hypothetical protein
MDTKLTDTPPDVERIYFQIIRSMPVGQRFKLLEDLMMTSRRLALAGLRERFPNASESELRRRLATILLGPGLAAKVYGPEPDPPTLR